MKVLITFTLYISSSKLMEIQQMLDHRMIAEIENLRLKGKLRHLSKSEQLIDFSSNDYLGLAKRPIEIRLQAAGSASSRLIAGNNESIELFEQEFAHFIDAESALYFANGYLANVGLFSCIASREDTIIYDQYIHASIRDGIALSTARSFSFKHNCLDDLGRKLALSKGVIFIVVESVYSMDGDSPNWAALIELCAQYNAYLIVDEAHGMGCIGDNGKGLVNTLSLSKHIFARIFPLGKAFGMEGALIAGNTILRKYLINFCRPFIYTTGPAPFKVAALIEQLTIYRSSNFAHPEASSLKELLLQELSGEFNLKYGTYGNIIMVVIPGNKAVMAATEYLHKNGLDVKGIRSPTVPVGQECLRICVHNYNTQDEILQLSKHLSTYAKNL
jgi:8-amino-7-oxononanoate synthase